ncbi:hypothetical protein Tco_1247005 [Tanacetum coccineum]
METMNVTLDELSAMAYSWKVYSVICSTNYSNGENQVVSKSSAVTTADASDKRQQQQDSTSSTSTLATTITADGNFDLTLIDFSQMVLWIHGNISKGTTNGISQGSYKAVKVRYIRSMIQPNRRDLPKNTPLDRVEVLGFPDGRASSTWTSQDFKTSCSSKFNLHDESSNIKSSQSLCVSKEKSTDKGKRYRRRASIEEVSTGSTKGNSGTASERGQREGNAPMVEENIQATHKTKEQLRQEEAGLEEAIKLQAQLDKEVAKQIHLDKMIAKRMAEEETQQQKKRKAQVQFEAQFYTEEDLDTIRAKERAKAKRNKPITHSQLRIYMSNYLKNQGTWKLSQLKKLKFEEIKEELISEDLKKQRIDDKDV